MASPISEIVPEASKNLHGGKKFWLRMAPGNFLPEFPEQIVGMNPGETRSVQVEFPAEFPVPELAGKRADYAVTLNEIKQQVLPELDDAFAAKMLPGKTLPRSAPRRWSTTSNTKRNTRSSGRRKGRS